MALLYFYGRFFYPLFRYVIIKKEESLRKSLKMDGEYVEMIEVVLWKSVAHKWFDLAITMEIIR
jgi:hypothetical protein